MEWGGKNYFNESQVIVKFQARNISKQEFTRVEYDHRLGVKSWIDSTRELAIVAQIDPFARTIVSVSNGFCGDAHNTRRIPHTQAKLAFGRFTYEHRY